MASSFSASLRANLAWLVPAALTVLAWGAVALGSFQYDDFANILEDPATHHLDALVNRLTSGIRPLTRLSYALSEHMFGDWAGGWLVINLLLHLFTAMGVAKLVQLRTLNPKAAALAGACFALQPANAEVIAYVSGRSTGLAVALIVAAMLVHECSAEDPDRAHARIWAILLFLCGCTAKETTLVFPALILLWERTRAAPTDWSMALKRAAPYAIASIVAASLMLLFSPRYRELLAFSLSLRSPRESLINNLIAMPLSISLWFRPWALSVEHELHRSALMLLAGAALVTAAVVIAIRERPRRPFITLALLWPLLAMLPTHSVIAKVDAVTEGSLYLAWVGPSVALGEWFAWRGLNREWLLVKPLVLALGAVLIILCQWRVSVWRDPVALWQEATLRAPDSARAWSNLGVAQLAHGENESARLALQAALHLDPNNTQARFNLDIIAAFTPSSRSTLEP